MGIVWNFCLAQMNSKRVETEKCYEKCYKKHIKLMKNVTNTEQKRRKNVTINLEILWKNVNMNVRKGNPNIWRA